MQRRNVYIAASIEIDPNWQSYVPEPKCPGNWKPETFQAKLPELREKQMATLDTHYAGSNVKSVSVITQTPGEAPTAQRSVSAATFTQEMRNTRNIDDLRVFGIETLATLRHIAWSTAEIPPAWFWNAGIDSQGVTLVNLYSCTDAKGNTGMSPAAFFEYFTGSPPKYNVLDATDVYELATRLGF